MNHLQVLIFRFYEEGTVHVPVSLHLPPPSLVVLRVSSWVSISCHSCSTNKAQLNFCGRDLKVAHFKDFFFFFSASDGSFYVFSAIFLALQETQSDRVTHVRVHVVWMRPEGAESRWTSSEANVKSRQSSTCRKIWKITCFNI